MTSAREPRPAVAWLVLASALAAIVVSATTGIHAREHAKCQARVNEDIARVVSARAEAADVRDNAWDTFVDDSLAAKTPQQRAAALERWKQSRALYSQHRKDNPFPALPSQTCR